jgi:hypothetical protein
MCCRRYRESMKTTHPEAGRLSVRRIVGVAKASLHQCVNFRTVVPGGYLCRERLSTH